jgi:hypothetical protein
MKQDIISKRARSLLAEELSSWSLGDISRWFSDAGVELRSDLATDVKSAASLVAGHLKGLDFTLPSDVAKFVKVANPVVREVEGHWEYRLSHSLSPERKDENHPLAELITEMERCGFSWSRSEFVDGSLSARVADIKAYAREFELAHLGGHINRIEKSILTQGCLTLTTL